MFAKDVRRIVTGWQVVAEVERQERRQDGPDSAAAIRDALELLDLFGDLHGWPPPENEGRRRDDELARQRWDRVRAYYRTHGETAKPKAQPASISSRLGKSSREHPPG